MRVWYHESRRRITVAIMLYVKCVNVRGLRVDLSRSNFSAAARSRRSHRASIEKKEERLHEHTLAQENLEAGSIGRSRSPGGRDQRYPHHIGSTASPLYPPAVRPAPIAFERRRARNLYIARSLSLERKGAKVRIARPIRFAGRESVTLNDLYFPLRVRQRFCCTTLAEPIRRFNMVPDFVTSSFSRRSNRWQDGRETIGERKGRNVSRRVSGSSR